MEYFGLLESLTKSVSSMTGMLSIILIPLIVGLLPMPGGALLSAVMIANLLKEYSVNAENATYINYWFRHLWVTVWPLYPNFVVGAAVVDADYIEVFLSTYPIAIFSLLSGLFITLYTRRMRFEFKLSHRDLITTIYAFYPVIIVAFLALVFRIDLLLTLVLSLTILYIHKRAKYSDFKNILKKTIDFKIILLVFSVMIYKELIEYTNSAGIFFNHLNEWNFPPVIASFVLSFIIGFSTGVEISYTSIALPLLTQFTGVGDVVHKNLMLVFGAGYIGVMMSPLHLCLVFSAEYYKAKLIDVYKLLIPTSLMFTAIMIAYYLI
jgi:hypothetical protein